MWYHKRCSKYCVTSVILSSLWLTGCGSQLAPSEMKVKEKVEELGGKALVKDKHIVKVDLSNSKKVEDSDLPMFESLPKLEVLNLQSTSVTDEVFKVATKIESLKDLDVSLTKITQEAADRFRRMYPKMSVSGPGA